MKKDKKSEGKVSITTIVKTFGFRSAARGKKKQAATIAATEVTKKEVPNSEVTKDEAPIDAEISIDEHNIPAQAFTFRQMAAATNNFSSDNFVGEGGFGRVYRGYIESIDKVVAIKSLDKSGVHGSKVFLSEVFMLSLVSHPSLVNLIGYCADGDQRMLVHEFVANGSLENHLLDLPPNKEPLDWRTRMKIAEGAAKGLQYLHETANPPIIYRDFKASNILLDEEFNPKLSDFGLARMGPAENEDNFTTRVMGTYGYCAPEYGMTGELTTKSDIYSFGVVFLELVSGRRAIDPTKPTEEQNLVPWAEPLFKDRNMFMKMVDPRLGDRYPVKGLQQALAVAAMCLQEEPSIRPLISDIVTALESLANSADDLQSPTKDSESLTNNPGSQGDEPKSLTDDPESQANEPESPIGDHESPTVDLEIPIKDSESPTNNPERQADEPQSPTDDPESQPNEPESPTDDPESHGDEPESLTDDPQSQANEPEKPTDDLESPPVDHESQSDDPESPADDPESPTDENGSGSDELGSPTGIVIRGNDTEADDEAIKR